MRTLLIILLVLAGFGCGDDLGAGGAGGEGGVGGVGDSLDLNIGPGEVRAGRLSAAQLPDDPNGLAMYEEGDFALVNEHIALLIEDEGVSELYMPFAGLVVGIARYREGALVDRADFNEVGLGLRRFLVAADTVSIVNDGTDGRPAVVRAEGPLRALPFLEDLLGGTAAGALLLGPPPPEDEEFQATRVQVDYELAAGAEHVDVYYTLDKALDVVPTYLFFQDDRMPGYVPGQGFGVGDLELPYPYMAWVDDDAVGYAVQAPAGPMSALFAAAGAFGFSSPVVSGVLPLAGQQTAFEPGQREHLMRIHIGGNGLEGLRQAIARTQGEATRTISGTVRHMDGSTAEGVRVHAETAEAEPSYLTRVTTDAEGRFAIDVPEAQEVQLRAFRRGDGLTEPTLVDAATDLVELELPPAGAIHVVAREADTALPLPVRVQVIPDAETPQPPGNFGEPRVPQDDRLHVVFPTDGEVTLSAPVGNHRVVVSRGYEYDIVDTFAAVTAGEQSEVTANLRRVVDSSGVMCGDFHIHTHRSPDSPDPPVFKLQSAAGDGVELPVRTDHEFVAAFEPLVEAAGVADWLYGLSSLELTTFSWGHFGVFPIEPDSSAPNDGAIMWNGLDGSGDVEILEPVPVFQEARSRPGDPEVIIFHPRPRPGSGGGFDAISGGAYFAGIGTLSGIPVANTGGVDYDPSTDRILREDIDPATWWDKEFKAVEVFNDSSFEENKKNAGRIYGDEDLSEVIGTVDDWFGLLNSPERDGVFAVGSSDSHAVMAGSPVGYPRTCLFVGTDDPQALRSNPDTPQIIKGLVRTGRAVINGGIFITAASASSGEGPGQTVSGSGPYLIDVKVQAPLWVGNVELIEMWVSENGIVTRTEILTAPDPALDNETVVRFDQAVPVPDGADWVVFHARGAYDPTIRSRSEQPQTLAPVHPDRLPFGVTNPIFFDGQAQ
jgi:hypothetical protein